MVYKESDPNNGYGTSIGAVIDTVMDFNVTRDLFDFTEITGLTYSDLAFGSDAEGDATTFWYSGSIEVVDIMIELRDVGESELNSQLLEFG